MVISDLRNLLQIHLYVSTIPYIFRQMQDHSKMPGRRAAFINAEPAAAYTASSSKEAVKVEFARRLNRLMVSKGWNQSRLAVEAELHAPEGSRMGRDKISNYIRARVLPTPAHLEMLCRALDCSSADLIPPAGVPEAGEILATSAEDLPELDLRENGQGTAWLTVNQSVPWHIALKIALLLRGEEAPKE